MADGDVARRGAWGSGWAREVGTDLKVVVRQLARSPGFTLAALASLALGLAANAVVLTLVDGYFLRPLPYPAADRLVAFWETEPRTGEPTTIIPANLQDWKAAGALESIAGYNISTASVTGPGAAGRVPASVVEPHFFDVLGARPLVGPGFDRDARATGQVVISHRFWQDRFAGATDVVGRSVEISGTSYTVVGVMPADFRHPERELEWARPELWTALDTDALATDRRSAYLRAVGRLASGASVGSARREVEAIQGRLVETYPDVNAGRGVLVRPLADEFLAHGRSGVLLLAGAGVVLLLLVCGNLATLVLSRAEERTREFALRAALGSGRLRLVRQVLVEAVALTLVGGLLGLGLLAAMGDRVVGLQAARLSPLADVSVGARSLVLVLGLALVTAVLAGLLPAWRVAATDLRGTLSAPRGRAGGDARARSALVVGELALTVTLVVAGSLLLRSFSALVRVPPGFQVEGVALVDVGLPAARYADADAVRAFYTRLTERVAELPDVQAVGLLSDVPFTGENRSTAVAADASSVADPEASTEYHVVGPGYFEAVGMTLVAGRRFLAGDGPSDEPAAVLNETLAARLWPGADPLGRTVFIGRDAAPTTVVGVVPDVLDDGFDGERGARLYLPFLQRPSWNMVVVARSRAGDEARLGRTVRDEIAAMDGQVPAEETSLARLATASTAASRDAVAMAAALALLAVVLAAVGVYGVMARLVASRTREIGIRAALGAARGQVAREVLGRSGKLVMWGGLLGLLGALAASRVVRGLLFGVSPADPVAYGSAVVVLATVALAAAWGPARRAASVDPMEAMRSE